MLHHLKVGQRHPFALPFHHQIVDFAGVQLQQHGKIRLDVDFFAVQFHDAVANPQAILPVDGAEGFKAADHRRDFLLHGKINHNHQQHAHQEIHGGTRHQNDQLFPPCRFVKGTGIVAAAVLTLHGAVAANGNQADGVQRFPNLL